MRNDMQHGDTTEGTFRVRSARPEDLDELLRLCALHADYERAEYNPAGKREGLQVLLFGPRQWLFCLVVERAGESRLAGYASWSLETSTWDANRYVHMDCLYLDPDARGHGLGRMLMKCIAKAALVQGVSCMQWQTPDFNIDAIRFYSSLGAGFSAKYRYRLDSENLQAFVAGEYRE